MKFMYVYSYVALISAFMVPARCSQAPVLSNQCSSVSTAILVVFERNIKH